MKTYEQYKDSGVEWIGNIPAHWEVKSMKRCLIFQTGFTPSTSRDDYFEGQNTWVTIADMQAKIVSASSNCVSDEAVEDCNGKIVPKGSLLFSFKLSVGKVAFAGKELFTNEAIISILPKKDVCLDFFYYTLPLQLIENAGENIYGAKLLNQELIKNALLLIPPADEQTAIAQYLDRKTEEIDALLSAKETLLQKLAAKRAATVNDAVTKGLDAEVKMKDSGIEWLGEIPAHWEVKKLKYLVDKIGSGVTPKGGAEVYETSGITFLRSQNIYNDGLRLDDVAFILPEVHEEMSGSKVLKDDVLLNITGASIGRCYFFDGTLEEANVNQHVSIIRPQTSKLETKFLHALLCAEIGQLQIESLQTGANREGLTKGQLNEFRFPIPPAEEQSAIMESVSQKTAEFDDLSQKLKTQIEKLRAYRQSLITEVVTGKQRVTE